MTWVHLLKMLGVLQDDQLSMHFKGHVSSGQLLVGKSAVVNQTAPVQDLLYYEE